MSGQRKLQQEMDKVFKKILEGLEIFDTLYERHQNASNSSQKEKLENDLKKEIKKLQRFREQVKNWQAASEVKDKNALLEHRRLVEVAMEKYKIVEKGSKTKAYSDQSLANAEKPDVENEAIEFVKNALDTLQQQTESLDFEIEKLQPSKKSKKNLQIEEQKKELDELLASHRWHTEKLEIVLRLLQNEVFSVDEVMNISDDITYYLDENRNPDFVFDDTIYDELDLEADQTLIHEIHVIPSEDHPDNSISPENSTSSIHPKKSLTTTTSSRSNSNVVPLPKSAPALTKPASTVVGISKSESLEKPQVIQSIGTSVNNQATVTTLKPAPVPSTNEIKWSNLVTATKKKEQQQHNQIVSPQPQLQTQRQQQQPPATAPAASSTSLPTMNSVKFSNGSAMTSSPTTIKASATTQPLSSGIPSSKKTSNPSDDSGPPGLNSNALNAASVLEALKKQKPRDSSTPNVPQDISQMVPNSGVPSSAIAAATESLNFKSSSNSNEENISNLQLSGFTKSQELASANDGFRFLPPGIQSFILSISSSRDISNMMYNPFRSVNHTPNRTYPSGLKGIQLTEAWNKVKKSQDLNKALELLDLETLFFGYYYGRSQEERNAVLKVLNDRYCKQHKVTHDWYIPKSPLVAIVGAVADYSIFNVDSWTFDERKNIKLDVADFI